MGAADLDQPGRLQRRQGRTQEAHGLLASVYGRFTEGFETADLLTAKQFLDEPA
jgi:predicted ATPase